MPHAELVDAYVAASRALVGVAVRSIESADVPLTVVQHRCLVVLETEGALTIGGIATELGVNQSNASRLCDRLERLGLVLRETSPEDRRSVRARLTPQGRSAVATVTKARRREIRRVLRRMEYVDARAALAALTAFSEAAHDAVSRAGV